MNEGSEALSDAKCPVPLDTDILEVYVTLITRLIKSELFLDAAKAIEAVPISLQDRSELVEQKLAAATAAKKFADSCFVVDNFNHAIKHYSIAIQLENTNHIYYSNRSRAYQKIKSWTCAVADARKVAFFLINHPVPLNFCCLSASLCLFLDQCH